MDRKKKCKQIALACKSLSEFKRTNGSAYESARTNGWLYEYEWFVDTRVLLSEASKKEKENGHMTNVINQQNNVKHHQNFNLKVVEHMPHQDNMVGLKIILGLLMGTH